MPPSITVWIIAFVFIVTKPLIMSTPKSKSLVDKGALGPTITTNAFFANLRRSSIDPLEIVEAVIITCLAFGSNNSAASSG